MTAQTQIKPKSLRSSAAKAEPGSIEPARASEWAGLTTKEKHELAGKMLRQLRIDVERSVADSKDLLKALS